MTQWEFIQNTSFDEKQILAASPVSSLVLVVQAF